FGSVKSVNSIGGAVCAVAGPAARPNTSPAAAMERSFIGGLLLCTGIPGLQMVLRASIRVNGAVRLDLPAAAPLGAAHRSLDVRGLFGYPRRAPRGAPHARSAAQRPVCGKNHRPAEEACR